MTIGDTKGLPKLDLDAVYFLMFPGWEKELRSNRWHYASRWARHISVTLVQGVPSLGISESRSVAEPRIERCRILYVRSPDPDERAVQDGLIQAEQIRRDIAQQNYKRVAFWLYNPAYFMSWGMLPATVRVVHATENYFMYSNNTPEFLPRLKYCLRHADVAICCSEGVARSYSPHAGGEVVTITNGCDHEFYSKAEPDKSILALHGEFQRIAIFAGNIDERLDYDALLCAAERNKDVLIALFGPTNFLEKIHSRGFKRLVACRNVRHFGIVPVERLPSVYAACDLGILPYVYEPLLYENTFPLKTFEFVAAGLPVVARNLKMIEPFAGDGLIYECDTERFADAIGSTARASLTDAARARLESLGRAQDYDVKFTKAREVVSRHAERNAPNAPMMQMFAVHTGGFQSAIFLPALGTNLSANFPLRHLLARVASMLPIPAKQALKRMVPNSVIRFIVQ